ncbi:MAG: type II toxin-antitoxin system RelE/ParE family toxin [Rhodospirillales bacterium]|nr:type II toxin-antitoxin system RelE/ParE family toxin [Rhodospirillales bacterium]
MAEYRLSHAAESDLLEIARYTVRQFGQIQAKTYRDGFAECFALIAKNPKMGREQDHIRLGLRRHDHKSHAIYYIETDAGVLIVRILHERHNPAHHWG